MQSNTFYFNEHRQFSIHKSIWIILIHFFSYIKVKICICHFYDAFDMKNKNSKRLKTNTDNSLFLFLCIFSDQRILEYSIF